MPELDRVMAYIQLLLRLGETLAVDRVNDKYDSIYAGSEVIPPQLARYSMKRCEKG